MGLAGAVAMALALQMAPAPAATTALINVEAVIARGCVVALTPSQTTGIALGTLDFGSHSPTRTGSVTVPAGGSSAAQIQCTPGTTLKLTAGPGMYSSAGQRRMASGTAFIPYTLALANGTVLAPNTPTDGPVMGTVAVTLPIQGTVIFPGTGLTPGNYTDTVQITLSW